MTFIRSDKQVALNDLLVAAEKSADLLRDAADALDDAQMHHALEKLASRRELVVQELRQAVLDLDDMPSAPDPDTESTEKLLQRVSALFSGQKSRETLLQQRLAMEEKLTEILADVQQRGLGQECDRVVYDFNESVREVSLHLKHLIDECAKHPTA